MKIPLVFALVGTVCGAALAQPDIADPLPQGVEQGAVRNFQLRLKNIKPSLLAWWLEPDMQQRPQLVYPRPKTVRPGLPVGVQRIVAVDPQNALLVFGTEAGVTALSNLIAEVDKPQPARPEQKVEVKLGFYQVDSNEIGKLRIDVTKPKQRSVGHFGDIQELRAAFAPLITDKKLCRYRLR